MGAPHWFVCDNVKSSIVVSIRMSETINPQKKPMSKGYLNYIHSRISIFLCVDTFAKIALVLRNYHERS